MSNSLAIAAVTKTLQNVLTNQFLTDLTASAVANLNNQFNIQNFTVTTKPLDKARPANFNKNQLNLFLFQVSPNGALRNTDMPGQVMPGESGQPPAALDLHYLVTAYGQDDDDARAHMLMGQVVRIFHDRPLLDRADIQAALIENDLHLQVERVRLTPQPISIEEMSKMWSTFQTQYRVSSVYVVSVVLIESQQATRTPLPVLRRGVDDSGVKVLADLLPPYPTLQEVQLPANKASAELGDTLTFVGHHLKGDSVDIYFSHPLLNDPITLVGVAAPDGRKVTIKIPAVADDPAAPRDWPAGFYRASARVTTGTETHESNELAFPLAAHIETLTPTNPVHGAIDFTIKCRPQVRPGQRAAMLLSSEEILAEPFSLPATASAPSQLTFKATDVDAGTYYVRLRVDGVDSLLIKYSGTPPKPGFNSDYKVEVA